MSEVKKLVMSIVKFLRDQLQKGDLTSDAKESVEVALQCLETAYGINPDDPTSSHLHFPRSLLDIFTEAVRSHQSTAKTPPQQVSEQARAEAEKLKNDGNNLMKAERFKEALETYSKAIELDRTNAVYYCNRAAAYSKLNDFDSAIEDCQQAIAIDPQYSKAYGRMGLAYASRNEHEKARQCYQRAVQLEPSNESYRNNLKIAEEKVKESSQNPSAHSIPGSGMSNPIEISSLLGNPTLVNMATQLMQDPNMQNLMSGLMSGGLNQGPAGGGMDALLQAGQQLAAQMQAANPDLVEQLRRQMSSGNQNQNTQNPSDNKVAIQVAASSQVATEGRLSSAKV